MVWQCLPGFSTVMILFFPFQTLWNPDSKSSPLSCVEEDQALLRRGGNSHRCSVKFLEKKISLPDPLVYLFIQTYILSLWTHVHLLHVLGNNLIIHYLFYCSSCSSFDHWEFLQVGSCVLSRCSHPVVFLRTSLLLILLPGGQPLTFLSLFSGLQNSLPFSL